MLEFQNRGIDISEWLPFMLDRLYIELPDDIPRRALLCSALSGTYIELINGDPNNPVQGRLEAGVGSTEYDPTQAFRIIPLHGGNPVILRYDGINRLEKLLPPYFQSRNLTEEESWEKLEASPYRNRLQKKTN